MRRNYFFLFLLLVSFAATAQKQTDVNAPLHALQPDYPVPYRVPSTDSVKKVLDRIYTYLDAVTPAQFVNRKTNEVFNRVSDPDTNIAFKPGDFRLTSYEWGVTYGAMLHVAEVTKDNRYSDYTKLRMNFIAEAVPAFRSLYERYPKNSNPLRQPAAPHALDDAGAMCAAMIKTYRLTNNPTLRPLIDSYINYISTKEFRLKDGTLARNRPLKNTLWLDDLYMSVPALAQMGKLTGDSKYYDDAVKQILQFSKRMFNKDLGIYMHGWVEDMNPHPEFHWARANGWAVVAMTELLEVLPENYKGRAEVLQQLKAHIYGLAKYQSDKGFWHQLIDRNDSYLETSATAMYAYCIARAVNKGWINAKAFGPMSILAWNAVTTKVNEKGQVEGTCVGTGMAFDPAFYYYRPTNVYAAHGYGPVLMAGAEIISLLNNYTFDMNDSAIQLREKK
jgi:rhamnogalacturonyl hydrolase YesR